MNKVVTHTYKIGTPGAHMKKVQYSKTNLNTHSHTTIYRKNKTQQLNPNEMKNNHNLNELGIFCYFLFEILVEQNGNN